MLKILNKIILTLATIDAMADLAEVLAWGACVKRKLINDLFQFVH